MYRRNMLMRRSELPMKLLPGYAETSTRRHPKQPETVIVGQSDCDECNYVGSVMIDGMATWVAFRNPKTGRYYFQNRPW